MRSCWPTALLAGADTWATSYTLARAAAKIGPFDLIVCGKQAVDGDTAQVGPGVAAQLGWPQVCFVRKLVSVDPDAGSLVAQRMMDDGYDVVEASLPCVLTVVKEIGELRVPSLKGKMKAKKLQVTVYTAADLEADPDCIGLPGSPTQVIEIFAPQPRGTRVNLEGTPAQQAKSLVDAGCGETRLSAEVRHEYHSGS